MKLTFDWDGVAVPFPDTLEWGYQEISSAKTGRSLSTKMVKQIIGIKRTLSCSWRCLDDDRASFLLGTIKTKTFGSLTYPDPFSGVSEVKRFYTGDAKAKAVCVHEGIFVWDVNFDFIEE